MAHQGSRQKVVKRRVPMTEERMDNVLKDALFVGCLAEVIKVAHSFNLIDTELGPKVLNKYAEHIEESANGIHRELSKKVQHRDIDQFQYEHAVALHRTLRHFIQFETEDLNEMMDRIDARKAEELKKSA